MAVLAVLNVSAGGMKVKQARAAGGDTTLIHRDSAGSTKADTLSTSGHKTS